MYANNEIGTIQPMKEIGKIIRAENQKREKKNLPKIFFHTDAVQAVNYLDCRVDNLGVDLLTASAHKIYGPKGVGLSLYSKKYAHPENSGRRGTRSRAFGPEHSMFPGLSASEPRSNLPKKKEREISKSLKNCATICLARISKEIKGVKLNGSKIKRIPNNLNLTLKMRKARECFWDLILKGIAVSTGSACSSGDLRPSHVLTAIGLC